MFNRTYIHNLPSKQKGFTLIEVLVASFILFLVIASITVVYRGALLSSGKAERTLLFSSFVEPISEQIRIQVQSSVNQEQLEDQGTMGSISYDWSALVVYKAKAPEQFNLDTGELDKGKKTFLMWNITLHLQLGSATRQYEFSEVSW